MNAPSIKHLNGVGKLPPAYSRDGASIYLGDCLQILKQLPDGSVHCCITSPPYWGLRDYGVEGQLGLEDSPEAYVSKIVEIFREVRRVLRKDGTLWLNLGDSYAGKPGGGQGKTGQRADRRFTARVQEKRGFGLKSKDLVGVPWRVAFALQEDGWYLRSDIIWSKPNPMPESVTDRPTKSHEYIFLLTKSASYYYDAEAVKEPVTGNAHARGNGVNPKAKASGPSTCRPKQNKSFSAAVSELVSERNKRSVWIVATQPYPEAHFATFPPKLIEPCVLAGTSEKGCCPHCGAPWERLTQKQRVKPIDYDGKWSQTDKQSSGRRILANVRARRAAGGDHDNPFPPARTTGWRPSCDCPSHEPAPCVVLDPFNGSGTTGQVALEHRRSYVGIELNPEYVELTRKRLRAIQPMLF